MKYLLDTDHISALQRRTGSDFDRLDIRMRQHPSSEFGLSVISFHEQAVGAHTFIVRARRSEDVVRGYALYGEILRGFSGAPVLPFDAAAASLVEEWHSQGRRGHTMDLRIAAIAVSRRLTLLTRNLKDFEGVPTLKVEDWLDGS